MNVLCRTEREEGFLETFNVCNPSRAALCTIYNEHLIALGVIHYLRAMSGKHNLLP